MTTMQKNSLFEFFFKDQVVFSVNQMCNLKQGINDFEYLPMSFSCKRRHSLRI